MMCLTEPEIVAKLAPGGEVALETGIVDALESGTECAAESDGALEWGKECIPEPGRVGVLISGSGYAVESGMIDGLKPGRVGTVRSGTGSKLESVGVAAAGSVCGCTFDPGDHGGWLESGKCGLGGKAVQVADGSINSRYRLIIQLLMSVMLSFNKHLSYERPEKETMFIMDACLWVALTSKKRWSTLYLVGRGPEGSTMHHLIPKLCCWDWYLC